MKEHHGIWTKEFIMVFVMSLFSSTAAYMTYPLITQYALSIRNDIGLASTIAGLMSLMGLLISPFAGMITDSFNIKKVLQCSYLFYVFILLSHILATNIPLLIIMRLLVGISFAVNSVAGTVFSTHFIVRERMAEGLGYAALANILAQAIGPGLGLYLVELSGYSLTFFAAAM
ncbi:MAG: MFS transporter, partial [Erysipelotrichaceae bacterium]|nr:MFS transporter [Erysipelotrichaceae bacterium]